MGIAIKKLKLDVETLKEAVLEIDEAILNEDVVLCLHSIVPTEEEKTMFGSYKGDQSVLDTPEKYLLALCGVARLAQRLDSLTFKVSAIVL